MRGRTLLVLLFVGAACGCQTRPSGDTTDQAIARTPEPRPVKLEFERRIPSGLPDVLEMPEEDGTTTMVVAREVYARQFRDGWYECLGLFIDGEIGLGEPDARPASRAQSGRAAEAFHAGFSQCLTALRRAADGDATRLRAALVRPTWYERIDDYSDEHVRRELDEADAPLLLSIDQPLSRETAFALLLRSEVFTSTAVGDGGQTPIHVFAFRRLLERPDAREVFADLLRRGRPAGQLFALCGLFLTDRDAFDREVQPFRSDAREVMFLRGCIMDSKPVHEVVESRDPRVVRLRRGQTWREWFDEFTAKHGEDVFADIDVLGGGWAQAFKDVEVDAPTRAVGDDPAAE
jgi:hypothetical protein